MYTLIVLHEDGTTSRMTFADEREAQAGRDTALGLGFARVRIVGVPEVMAGGAGREEDVMTVLETTGGTP